MYRLQNLLVSTFLLTIAGTLTAQVELHLALQPDGQTYTVFAKSQADLLPPTDHVLHEAKVAIVVPADGMELSGLQSHLGQWELGHLIQQPVENPGADYIVFQLIGAAADGAFPAGEGVPLFSFKNALGCTGSFELMDLENDPFLLPNSLGINISHTFLAEGSNDDAYLGNYDLGLADCTRFADCSFQFLLELKPSGKYQIDLIVTDTLAANSSLEYIRAAVKVPKYFFQLHELTNLQFGLLDFAGISRNDAPVEAPEFDYLQFRLKSESPDGLPLIPGDTLALLSFGNGGSCSGDSVFLVKNNDDFRPPNSQAADIGQQILLTDNAIPQGVCITGGGAAECLSCAFSDEIIDIYEVISSDPVACLGGDNGMLKFFAEGADSLHFSIDGGMTWAANDYFDGLAANIYQPVVEGSYYGCEVATHADPVELTEATVFQLQLDIPTTVCESENLALQIMSPSPLPVGTVYDWAGPAGFTSAIADPAIFSIEQIQSGQYSLTVEAPGCDPATATATTDVKPLPEVPTLLANGPICKGDTLKLNTDVDGATFEWLGPGGQSSTTLSLPGLTTAAGQTALPPDHPAYLEGGWQVRITDDFGCISQSALKEISIKNRPQAFAENDGPVCLGKPASLSANAVVGANYRWRKAGETTVFSTQPNVTLSNVTQQESYELEVEMDGCFSENISLTTVALHPKPAAFPVFEYEPAADCAPQDLQLTANGNGIGLTYEWAGVDNFVSQLENPIIPQANSAANGSYQVQVTNMYGCSATSPFQITGVVDALPAPMLQTTGAVCPGEEILISADGYDGLAAEFTWKRNGSSIFGATTAQLELPAVEPSDAGLYMVEVKVGDCEVASAELLVEILTAPLPEPDFLLTFPCEGSTLQFFSNSNDIVGWDWSGPNNFSTTAASPLIYNAEFDDVGTYSLTVTGANGCTATDEILVDGILQMPDVPQVATNSPVCPGVDFVLTVQNPVSLGSVIYDWRNGNGIPVGTGAPVLTLDPADPLAVAPFLVQAIVNGCPSELTDAIQMEALPMPVADAENAGPVCPGEEAQLFAASVPDASYEWRINGQSQVFSFAQNPTFTLNDTTTFELTVTTASCGAQASDVTSIFTKVKPEISDLTGGGSFCEGNEVTLSANNSAPLFDDLQYTWTGPNNFFFTASASATGSFPILLDEVQLQDEGVYTLGLESAEGCVSQAESVQVEVVEMPVAPVLTVADAALCESEFLQLDATAYTGNFIQYDWFFNDGSTDQLQGSTSAPTFFINDLTTSQSGAYFVKINLDGCEPPSSNLESVSVFGLPVNLQATTSAPLSDPSCEGEDVQLEVPYLVNANYHWSGPSGFESTLSNPLLENVTMAQAGNYSVEISFADCSVLLVEEAAVNISPSPEVPQLIGPQSACEGTEVSVEVANAEPGAVYDFYFSPSNILVETGSNPAFVLENVILGQSGNYHAVAALGDCLSANSNAFELTISPLEINEAFAGEPQVICTKDEVVFLSGNVPTSANGQWLALDGGVVLQSQSHSSQIQNLEPGENRFVWSWEQPVCQQFSVDTTIVLLENIEALPDVALVPNDDNPLEINVLENDFRRDVLAWDAFLLGPPAKGQVKIENDGTAVYSPWPNVFGSDEFSYQLCSMTCPEVCDSALVSLTLAGSSTAADCFVPNLVTPNGDGENDHFVVPCAAQWPGSSLVIFNRYGSRIFESTDYTNDWSGTYKNEPLPNGTYFFHLTLRDGKGSMLKGYVVLNR